MEDLYCYQHCSIFCHRCTDYNVDHDRMICRDCNGMMHLTILCNKCRRCENYDMSLNIPIIFKCGYYMRREVIFDTLKSMYEDFIKSPTMNIFKPAHIRNAEYMRKIVNTERFLSFKKTLNDVDMLDYILIPATQYVMMRFQTGSISVPHHPDKLHWLNFFEFNYLQIRNDRKTLNCELHEYLYHPSRIQKWIDAGNAIEEYMG